MRTVLESPPALASVLAAAYRRLTGVCDTGRRGRAAGRLPVTRPSVWRPTSDERSLDGFVDVEGTAPQDDGHTPCAPTLLPYLHD
ncbi:hypothetical protein SVIOM74S_04559 [Streptomyces violarus]